MVGFNANFPPSRWKRKFYGSINISIKTRNWFMYRNIFPSVSLKIVSEPIELSMSFQLSTDGRFSPIPRFNIEILNFCCLSIRHQSIRWFYCKKFKRLFTPFATSQNKGSNLGMFMGDIHFFISFVNFRIGFIGVFYLSVPNFNYLSHPVDDFRLFQIFRQIFIMRIPFKREI